jgi:hypothetical protein
MSLVNFVKQGIDGFLTLRPEGEVQAWGELAGVNLSQRDASRLLPRILEHKWFVSERLGRDVGLHAAVVDYLENVGTAGLTEDSTPSGFEKISSLLGRLFPQAAPGHSLGEFESAMRGTRSRH